METNSKNIGNKMANGVIDWTFTMSQVVQDKCVDLKQKLNKIEKEEAINILMCTSEYNRWRYFGKENAILDEAKRQKALEKARENKEQQQKESSIN